MGRSRKTLLLALVLVAVTQVAAVGHRASPHDDPGHRHEDSAHHEARHALEEGRPSDEQLALLGLRRDEARCGKRMYVLNSVPDGAPAPCTHGPDVFAATPTVEGTYAVDTPPGIPCYTTAGKRVKVIYAYKQGTTNRIKKRAPLIRETVAITDRAVAQSAKRSSSKVQHVRWLMNSRCKLRIFVYEVPAANATVGGLGRWLRNTGKLTRSQKALTFQEWPVDPYYTCSGLGETWPDERKSKTLNDNNVQQYEGMMTWVDAPGCLPDIRFTHHAGALVAAHELMHTLGAVQMGAPNTDGGGHCTDEWDIMCYGDHTRTVCNGGDGLQGDRLFDCGHNDYYDPTPRSGSYLANYWNTARSNWLTTTAPASWDRLQRPTVRVLSPVGGSETNIPVTFEAKAKGNPVKATFVVNGKTVGTDKTRTSIGDGWYQFSVTLSTAKARAFGLANGKTVPVVAKAEDNIGRPGSHKVSVTVTAPTVSLGDPFPDEWGFLSAYTSWSATASAPSGRTISKVELLANGKVVATDTTAPYGGPIAFPVELWYSRVDLVARATDSAGSQMQTANRWVHLSEPQFEFATPPSAKVGVPYRAWLGGEAAAVVTRVELALVTYNSSTGVPVFSKIAEDATAPFVPSWTVTPNALAVDTFGLTGYDSSGAIVFREQIYASVYDTAPGDPTVTVTSPSDLSTVVEGLVPVVVSIDLGRFPGTVCTATVTTNCTNVDPTVSSNVGWVDGLTYHASTGTWRGSLDTTGGGWQRGGLVSVDVMVVSADWSDDANGVTSGPLVFLP